MAFKQGLAKRISDGWTLHFRFVFDGDKVKIEFVIPGRYELLPSLTIYDDGQILFHNTTGTSAPLIVRYQKDIIEKAKKIIASEEKRWSRKTS